MKNWYCVTTAYYDNGKTTAAITSIVEAEEQPENSYTSARDRDVYLDWYGSLAEAEKAVRDAGRA